MEILGWTLILSIGINLIFFFIAFWIKTDKFTDITYALCFIILNLFALLMNKNNLNIMQILVFIVISIWAFRLGTYLFVRILKIKKDARFDKMRNDFVKFLFFWIIQAFTIYILSIPNFIFLSMNISLDPSLNWLTFVLLVPLFFLVYESIADIQKFKFYNNKKGDFIKTGLYKFSRFPNYFGEMSFWFTLTIFEIIIIFSQTFDWSFLYFLLTLLSPLFLAITIINVSGIKLLDQKSYTKFKDNNDFNQYVKTTSMLLPLIGKKGYSVHLKKID